MSDEFGPSFITLTDEDGNDIELEYVDALEHEGQTYMAFFPAVEDEADEESEDYGLVILTVSAKNPFYFSRRSVIIRPSPKGEVPQGCDGSFLSSHFVIGDVGSVCGSQASRLPSAAGSWKR